MADQIRLFQLQLRLGAVGMMSITLVSVQERHQEIGIRRGMAESDGFAKASGGDFLFVSCRPP